MNEENRTYPKETDSVKDNEEKLTVDTDITKPTIVDEPNKEIRFVIDSTKTKSSQEEKEDLSVFTESDKSESFKKKHTPLTCTTESVESSIQEERETCSFSESIKSVALEEEKEESILIASSAEPLLFTTTKDDTIADLDLKMTEDESVIEKDKTCMMESEEAAEPLYENLKPLPFHVEENIEEEVTNQYNEDLTEGDVEDIYDDIIEDKEDCSSDEDKKSESQGESGEDNDSDVICLGSGSDEERQKKSAILLTSHTKVSDFSKQNLQVDETLDFEDETNDVDDDKDCNDEDSYHESSEENYDSSENEIQEHNTEMSYSDSSEEDNHQGNRSWKSQRKDFESEGSSEKEDIASDENTIESPPYELIGQDSQSNSHFQTQMENLKSVVDENTKQPIYHGCSDLNKAEIETDKSADHIKAEMSSFEDSKVVNSDMNNKNISEKAEFMLSESVHMETFEQKIDETFNMGKPEKNKCNVETGSILDLKLRRSKRYSSATNLSSSKLTRLRRKSSSAHDLTSLVISETKSATELSDAKSSTSISSSETDLCEDKLNLPRKRGRRSRLSQLQDITEENTENVSSPNDKTLRRSVSSNQLVEQQPVMGTSMKRSSSSSILSEYGKASELELGTNISKETHTGTMSSSNESSKIKLKKRWTLEMEAMNYITRKKRKSSVVSNSLEVVNSSDEEESEKNKSRIHTKESLESGPNNSSTVIVKSNDENEGDMESSVTVNTEDIEAYDCKLEVDTMPRIRSQSVPPTLEHSDPPALSTKRRSSSLIKIKNIHRKVLKRYSHKKSLLKSAYEPLEIVHSDEESIRETVQEKIQDCSEKLVVPKENIEDTNNSVNEIETTNMDCCSQDTHTVTSPPLHISRRNLRSSSEPPSYEDVEISKRKLDRRSSSTCKINKIHKLILSRHSHRKSMYSSKFLSTNGGCSV
ncbi:MATH and LRR domain-containing protein PFE0570w-like [Homalodisca vitripennis]|uniref:MATH and LRR domain-containing protein PFE0570w-like n=1 Tax=Homalodisca vitripennis TaxID=197043 RepID=UPI001EEA1056|nr:MATH and LRR domain-containing protein PFE0570w-like [Homalodisca vitripennis]